jgi:hypothetical protein
MELEQMQKNGVQGVETYDRDINTNEGGADTVHLARTGKKQVLKVKTSALHHENSRLNPLRRDDLGLFL